MTGTPVLRQVMTVPLPAGMLWLDGTDQFPTPHPDLDPAAATVAARLTGCEVSSYGGMALARLPASGTAVRIEVEVWDGDPEADLSGCQHAADLGLHLPDGVLYAGAVGAPAAARVEVPTGSGHGWHRALLVGSGLDSRLWADPDVPESRWRLYLWWSELGGGGSQLLERWLQPPPWAGLPGSAGSGRLLRRETVAVHASSGLFEIISDWDGDVDQIAAANTEAIAHGIGGDGGYVLVSTPMEWRPGLPVEVQLWDGEPPCDLDDWEEGHELGLHVASGSVRLCGYEEAGGVVQVPAGGYAARLYGRGFDEYEWADRDSPEDHWLLQLWAADPAAPLRPPVRVKVWIARPRFDPPPPRPEPEPEPVDPGPDPFHARGLRLSGPGFPGVPQDVIELLKPGVAWPGHPDYRGPG